MQPWVIALLVIVVIGVVILAIILAPFIGIALFASWSIDTISSHVESFPSQAGFTSHAPYNYYTVATQRDVSGNTHLCYVAINEDGSRVDGLELTDRVPPGAECITDPLQIPVPDWWING